LNITIVELHPFAALESARQQHRAVAYANKATHRMPHRLKHPSNFTISTFGDGYAVPAIRTFTPTLFNRPELRHTIIEFDTSKQQTLFLFSQGPKNANRVFTLQTKTRMHQFVR
jgi:hypothetical protein